MEIASHRQKFGKDYWIILRGVASMISLESNSEQGLLILARIIARDFMAKQTVNGDYINDCSNNRDIPDERSLP